MRASRTTASLCFVFSLFANVCLAQNPSLATVNIASPNAASLGKFADVPVGYNTGTPNIDIPIYTVEEGPLRLSISLSYHASGLKVMEQSSWVGAGWALNAGGVITRSVRGLPDEKAPADEWYLNPDKQGFYSYLYGAGSSPQDPLLNYNDINGGLLDTEPDLFFFNFNGYSGKFYFRADGTPVIVPQQDIRITSRICSDSSSSCNSSHSRLRGFDIITPDGVKYFFGIDDNNPTGNPAVERALPYSFSLGLAFSELNTISSWYLYKIESPDSKFEINLSYEKEEYSSYGLSLQPVANGSPGVMDLSKNYTFGQRLSTITFSNGTVTFNADSSPRQDLSGSNITYAASDYDNATDPFPPRALKSIQISSPTFARTFDFTTSYFVDNHPLVGKFVTGGSNAESTYNLHSDKKRLKLDKITERSDDSSVVKPPYSFIYYNESSVPRTLSLAQDHWGFYNGADGNTTLVPDYSLDGGWIFTTGGANREASFPNMMVGSLQKIIYPTGGTSEFTFGAHRDFANKKYYTETDSWQINAVGTGSNSISIRDTIKLTFATMFKYRARRVNGGDGAVYFGSTVQGDTDWEYKLILMPAGTHVFYCVSTGGNSSQGIQAELYQLEQRTNLETVLVGGLRVETLKMTDGTGGNDIVQTFDYRNHHSQDKCMLYSRPNYVGIVRNDRMKESGFAGGTDLGGSYDVEPSNGCLEGNELKIGIDGDTIVIVPNYYISPSSLHPMKTLQGGHVGYGQVRVTQADGGFTIYQYKREADSYQDVCVRAIDRKVCDLTAPNFPGAPDPVDFSRGELRRVYIFDAFERRLKSTHFKSVYEPEPVGVHGLIVKRIDGTHFATEYEMKTYKKTKSTTLEFTYNASSPTQAPIRSLTEVFYGSKYHALESKTVISEVLQGDSIENVVKGNVLSEKRISYVADLATSTCDPSYSWNTTYASTLASCLSTYNSAISGSCNETCMFNAWHQLTYCRNEARKTFIINKFGYEDGREACLTSKANAAVGELRALLDLKIRNQIDPVIEVSSWRNDHKFLQSVYTTFQDVNSNRIDIYPSKVEAILTNTPLDSTSFTAAKTVGTTLSKDVKYVEEGNYIHVNGNLVQVIGKDGITTSYLWGHSNTLPIVKAVGVSFSILNAAYIASGGNLTTLRSQPSVLPAQVTTYTYDPLVGMTSQTDANNFTTYFLYDKLGRLQFLKDDQGNVIRKMEYSYEN